MSRYPAKRIFSPNNPEKYIGEYPIWARSSWEWDFMVYCDNHPGVLEWASEPKNLGTSRPGIPYRDPLTGNQTIYIPDFLVTFITNGVIKTKLIEIKPHSQAVRGNLALKNQHKWAAAQRWAMSRGIDFQVLTEAQLYHGNEKKRGNVVMPYAEAQPKKVKPKTSKVNKHKTQVLKRKLKIPTKRVEKVGRVRKA